MFFFQRKYKEIQIRTVRIRNDWGELHEFEMIKGIPQLTDEELARQLQVEPTIVIRERNQP